MPHFIQLKLEKVLISSVLVIFALWFAVGPMVAQTSEAKVLSLDNAVNMALSNHPASKNAALKVEVSKAHSFQFEAANINWEYGQINSPVNDNRLTVSQNLGSPFTHYQRTRLYKNEIDISQSEQKIAQKLLVAKTKTAYFRWVHQISVIRLMDQQVEFYAGLLNALDQLAGGRDSLILEKTLAATKYAESQRKLLFEEEQLKLSVNSLNRCIFSEEVFQPSITELELYSIKFPIGITDRFDPYTFKDYYQQQLNEKKIELSLEKSKLFPELTGGYFRQEIHLEKNLQGFQFGVALPVLAFSQASRVKQAKIGHQMAINDVAQQNYELEQTIDDLKIRLDQQFINVVHYKERALNQAEQLVKAANQIFGTEKFEISRYLQFIAEALKIREDYLNTMLQYNLTALELEYYLN